jgi:hypothetical protein
METGRKSARMRGLGSSGIGVMHACFHWRGTTDYCIDELNR